MAEIFPEGQRIVRSKILPGWLILLSATMEEAHKSSGPNLADLETEHFFEVGRLGDKKQVESPATTEVGHDNGVDWHGREEAPPGCVKFLWWARGGKGC